MAEPPKLQTYTTVAVQDATAASVSYAPLYRCGLSPEQFFEAEDRWATPEEQEVLSRCVGWGGVRQRARHPAPSECGGFAIWDI